MSTSHEVQRERELHAATDSLADVNAKHLCFKPGPTTNAMLDIVTQMLGGKQWGDELVLTPGPDDRNCIGSAFKILMRAGLVEQTGAHRRSAVKEQKGRVCWQYRLPSTTLARTFLRRNGRVPVDPQMDFFK